MISVPALFELPQSAATSEAARLAGFERVELLQEPIASALAAGWRADDDGGGTWLVFDLGGGTFDASLLETRDGLLRVVGHDGDNFLGGRDFDWAITEHLASQLSVVPRRKNPEHAAALRALRLAAEDAKIELSRGERAQVTLAQPLVDRRPGRRGRPRARRARRSSGCARRSSIARSTSACACSPRNGLGAGAARARSCSSAARR